MDTSGREAEEGERTQAFPSELPMENDDYTLPDYYVRKCYSEYYDLILEMLKTYNIITVTGTPGIGKSIFYAYFYQRHKKSRPDTTIITASFTKDSVTRPWLAEGRIGSGGLA
ncbi:hypothetical protein V7S43_005530 [Phytophthora oleae]|uniref:Uncharacterized protein n=1 Tax=Phytophthora oleae TaxID=2107226 RepID=A0ABD3FTZ2_9STRA